MNARPPTDEAARDAYAALVAGTRQVVDRRLRPWLEARVARAREISFESGAAAEELASLTMRGGKRVRAALVGAGYAAAKGAKDWDCLGDVAMGMAAVEILQSYLLVHDDWMDHDAVRRGAPSVHMALRGRLGDEASGDAAAILAGDYGCGLAQEALCEVDLPPAAVLRAVQVFARVQVDVVIGQLAELEGTRRHEHARPSVELVHELKTASYTVTGPLTLGAALGGAGEETLSELARFGRPLGIAFQLRDDLLGVFGDSSATGKPVYGDLREGKRTALVAELRADGPSKELLARALGKADASEEDLAAIVARMEASGARARVEARVEELLGEARDALAALRVEGVAGPALEGAVGALGQRST